MGWNRLPLLIGVVWRVTRSDYLPLATVLVSTFLFYPGNTYPVLASGADAPQGRQTPNHNP